MKDIEDNINIISKDINEDVFEGANITISDENNENSKNNNNELNSDETKNNNNLTESSSTDLIEYKEIEEPCVALTIIGENKLSNTEVFIKRGIKYSIKAFFSGLILTIMNMFL